MHRSKVLLPQPLGPKMLMNSPSEISSATPSSAVMSLLELDAYSFLSSFTSM